MMRARTPAGVGRAAVLVAIAIMTAGCGGVAAPPDTAVPAAGSPAAGSPAAETSGSPTAGEGTAANTAEVCVAAAEASRALLQAMVSGVSGGGGDPEATAATMRNGMIDYAARLRAESARATDPAVRSALDRAGVAADEAAASPDLSSIGGPGFEQAGTDLSALCESSLTPPAGAQSVGRIGAVGTACELPVTFELAPSWAPQAIDIASDGEFAELARSGPFTAVCEVDAKPAGNIGFLRVYTAAGAAGPRAGLDSFLDGANSGNQEVRSAAHTELQIGGRPAAEVRYASYDRSSDSSVRHAAFAVDTPGGTVVVHLGGLDDTEHEEMLPAYELARNTLTVNG